MSVILVSGVNTMLNAKHEEGDFLRKTIYATLHNSTGKYLELVWLTDGLTSVDFASHGVVD
jgi:hypothetical protein